jgi:hypothetical protein
MLYSAENRNPAVYKSPEGSEKKVHLWAVSMLMAISRVLKHMNFELRKSNNGVENRIRMHERKV